MSHTPDLTTAPITGFWRTWLRIWCGAVALFGIILIGAGLEATSGPTRLFFTLIDGAQPLDLDAQARFLLCVLGAVTLGWSLTLSIAMAAADALGAQGRGVWRQIALAATVWFVIDTALSVSTGYGLNGVSNLILYGAFLLPILATGVWRA